MQVCGPVEEELVESSLYVPGDSADSIKLRGGVFHFVKVPLLFANTFTKRSVRHFSSLFAVSAWFVVFVTIETLCSRDNGRLGDISP